MNSKTHHILKTSLGGGKKHPHFQLISPLTCLFFRHASCCGGTDFPADISRFFFPAHSGRPRIPFLRCPERLSVLPLRRSATDWHTRSSDSILRK